MKEVAGTSLVKSKSSNINIKSRKPRGGNKSMMSNVKVESKESKKRGVYVEKWESPKKFQAEEIKRQPEESQSRPRPENRTSTSLASTSKILTSTRSPQALAAPNQGQTKLRKPPNKIPSVPSPTSKFPKQTSNTPNNMPVKQLKINNTPPKNTNNDKKNQRNIIEENKQAVKLKYRSNALRQTKTKDSEKVITLKSKKPIIQTPSDTSKITRNLSVSDHVHWSNIFPSDPQNNTNKSRLQEYIDNRLSVSKCALKNNNMGANETALNEATEESNEKDKQIYKFFKDLLESVYDENINNNKITTVHSGASSNVKFEIDENVAQKLYGQKPNSKNYKDDEKQSNRHTFKVKDDSFDQSQQLADYYNLRTTLLTSKRTPLIPGIPQKTTKNQRKTRNSKRVETTWKKSKKQDLLKLLKEQLSKNCNTYEEPENMYQALRALARRKCKRQICFDTPEKDKSDSDRICRFQRRNVISRSTGLPRKKSCPKSDIPTERYFFESDALTSDRESDHTLEVFGFDYDELQDIVVESLDNGSVIKYTKSFTNLNRGIKPLTHWNK